MTCPRTFCPSAPVSAEFILSENTFLSSCVINNITGQRLWPPISKWSGKTYTAGWGSYIRLPWTMRQESSRLLLKWKTIAAKGQVWCYLLKGDGPSNPCWLSSSHRQAVQQAPQQPCCQSHQRSPAWEIPPKRGSEVSSILRSLKYGENQGLLILLALVESSTITQTMPSLAQTNRPRGWEGRGKTGAGTVKWPWNWGQGRSWRWEGVLLQWWDKVCYCSDGI